MTMLSISVFALSTQMKIKQIPSMMHLMANEKKRERKNPPPSFLRLFFSIRSDLTLNIGTEIRHKVLLMLLERNKNKNFFFPPPS